MTTILTRLDMVSIRRHVSSSPRFASFRFSRRVLFHSLCSPLYVHRVTFSGFIRTSWRYVPPPEIGYYRLHRSSTFREMAETITLDGVKSRRPSLNLPNILEISTAVFLFHSTAAVSGSTKWAITMTDWWFSDKASPLCLNTRVNENDANSQFKHNFIYKQQSAACFGYFIDIIRLNTESAC